MLALTIPVGLTATEEEVIPKLGPSIEDFIIPISIGVGCLVLGSIIIVFIMKAKKKKKLN